LDLAVGKRFQEAVGHQPRYILPVIISFVSNFFLQHSANRNHSGKSIAKEHELQKKTATERPQAGRENYGDNAANFDDGRKQFEYPQIGQSKPADPAVARTEKHVAARP